MPKDLLDPFRIMPEPSDEDDPENTKSVFDTPENVLGCDLSDHPEFREDERAIDEWRRGFARRAAALEQALIKAGVKDKVVRRFNAALEKGTIESMGASVASAMGIADFAEFIRKCDPLVAVRVWFKNMQETDSGLNALRAIGENSTYMGLTPDASKGEVEQALGIMRNDYLKPVLVAYFTYRAQCERISTQLLERTLVRLAAGVPEWDYTTGQAKDETLDFELPAFNCETGETADAPAPGASETRPGSEAQNAIQNIKALPEEQQQLVTRLLGGLNIDLSNL